jgi:hypothetical protein
LAAKPKINPSDVFINAPFDDDYERVFVATLAGLVGLGLNPRCVLEIPPNADRLRRLHGLISVCPFSLHDLSRVQVSRSGQFRVPRFNMPFELGLAAAIAETNNGASHQWMMLEEKRFRLGQSLSDVSGYDSYVHGGTIEGMVDALLDIFSNLPAPPLSSKQDLMWVYRQLRVFQNTLRANLYRPNSFKLLVLAARGYVAERLA